MSRRARHRPEAIEVVRVHAVVPLTKRKAIRVATILQDDVEQVELRACSLDPKWEASVGDHRTLIRGKALGIIRAALEAAEKKIGEAAHG